MQRLRELRGVPSPAMASIPLQTSDYRALRQKDLDLEEETDGEGFNVEPRAQASNAPTATRLSTLTSIAATPWFIHALLLLVNVFTFAYVLQRGPSDAACTSRLSSWSPAIDSGVVQYKTIPINSSVEQEGQYNGQPSAEIDAAWANITTAVPRMRLSATDLGRLKKTTDGTYEEASGYAAQLEIYELLGCLNNLRKATYRSQYPEMREGTEGFDETAWHTDLDHCIDVLRVDLMCKSDVDILTYTSEGGLPDFSAVKKCRNFDEILAWSMSNSERSKSYTNTQNG